MTSFTRLRFGDIWWRVRSDAAELLFGPRGLRLANWLETGQASVVKQGPHRTVYRVQLQDRSVYIKHNRVNDARAMLSQWAQSSKGRREWNQVELAASHSIPTIEPLALGEQRKAGFVFENFLITEGLEGVEPLDHFVQHQFPQLPALRQSRIRRRLAEQLAELTARLHEAGIVHPDLHAGNVLIRLVDDDRIQLFVVDLHEASPVGRVNWRRTTADLLALGLYFLSMARGIDRARFLRRYLELRPSLGRDWRNSTSELEAKLHRRAWKFWRHLDYRCISNNRRFFYRNIDRAHGYAVTELGESAMLALLRDPDAPFRADSAEMLKDSPSSDVVRLPMHVGGQTIPVIYKRFNCPKWLDPLRATAHHSPALRAWHAGHGLLIRRIPTARPLAVLERFAGPFVRETYLITQAIPSCVSLQNYLTNVVVQLPPETRRRRVRSLMRQLGELVRRMHERKISHRDMKAANFLVGLEDRSGDAPNLYLIDLAGVLIWRNLPESRRLQNVSRIFASLQSYPVLTRTDALRFLLAYFPHRRRDPDGWKRLWRQIQGRVAVKLARNSKRKRPVV